MGSDIIKLMVKYSRVLVPGLALAAGVVALWWMNDGITPSDSRRGPSVALVSPPAQAGWEEPLRPLPPPPVLDPAKVELGRQLFHDPRLSKDDSLACAGCHDLKRGGVDGKARSVGVGGAVGGINAPTVLSAAYNFRQFWDGRAATLEDQAAGPITNPIEMASTWPEVLRKLGADRSIKDAFTRLYPEGLSPKSIVSAIADFERSLPRRSRFDRWLEGDERAINSDELAGYHLFKRHGCTACHQGVNIGGNLYQRFGVMADYFAARGGETDADQGRFNVTGQDEDRHRFKVPSLRNVALTAPYFHDGSAATLDQAVRIMGRYQLGMELKPRDVQLIVAFLGSLTSEEAP